MTLRAPPAPLSRGKFGTCRLPWNPVFLGFALACIAVFVPSEVRSQEGEGLSGPSESDVESALHRYSRGVALSQESAFQSALLEFERAYELAPNYRVLYNIAVCRFQLGQAARAFSAYQRYLTEGGDEIPGSRRHEVMEELETLRDSIAWLRVTSPRTGAQVLIDDEPVGTIPFPEPVVVDRGARRISLVVGGRVEAETVAVLSPQEEQTVHLARPWQGDSARSGGSLPEGLAARSPIESGPDATALAVSGSVTGALLLGTGVALGFALDAKAARDAELELIPADWERFNAARDELELRAIVTDVMGAMTAVSAGITAVLLIDFLLQEDGSSSRAPEAGDVEVSLGGPSGPAGLSLTSAL